MEDQDREMKRLQSAVRALEYENKRLKEQMAGMVTVLQVAKDLPRRGSYLIGKPDGTLLCSGKKPLNLAQVAGALLGVEGCATVTVFRLIPWRTVEVSAVTREWRQHSEANVQNPRILEPREAPVEAKPSLPKFTHLSRDEQVKEISKILGG